MVVVSKEKPPKLKGYVYRIFNLDLDVCYFGSAESKWDSYKRKDGTICWCLKNTNTRWNIHKGHYKEWLEGKTPNKCAIYPYFKEHGIENFTYEVLEEIEVKNPEDLTPTLVNLEQFYMDVFKCVNKQRAVCTEEDLRDYQKKYQEEHKEEIRERNKKYYQEHKEEASEYQKKYWKEHKEELRELNKKYREEHKEELKEYDRLKYERNKETIKERVSKWYEEHKEEIKKRARERVNCEWCGKEVSRANMSRHKKKCPNKP